MTLIEYLELEQPVHTPIFSVEIDPDEYPVQISTGITMWHKGIKIEEKSVSIKIFDQWINYVAIHKNLWTMDEDGNPGKPSVFKLK